MRISLYIEGEKLESSYPLPFVRNQTTRKIAPKNENIYHTCRIHSLEQNSRPDLEKYLNVLIRLKTFANAIISRNILNAVTNLVYFYRKVRKHIDQIRDSSVLGEQSAKKHSRVYASPSFG